MPNELISLLSPKEQKLLKPTPEAIAAEVLNEEVHEFVWNNLGGSGCDALNTHDKCLRKNNMTFNIFGKMCGNQCCNSIIKVMNPTGKALAYTKTLILTARDIANENRNSK